MSEMFDFISGKKRGKVAELEASLEYQGGVLESVLQDRSCLLATIKTAVTDLENGEPAAALDILGTALTGGQRPPQKS